MRLPRFSIKNLEFKEVVLLGFLAVVLVALGGIYAFGYFNAKTDNANLTQALDKTEQELTALKNVDQYKRNEALQKEIKDIETTYAASVKSYEAILKLKEQNVKTQPLDAQLAQVISLLSKRNFASASATLTTLNSNIAAEQAKLLAAVSIPANVPQKNEAPGSGYSRQVVATDFGSFMVDIIAGDLGSTRVVVDTASDSTCRDNCPVASLGSYAGRSGAYAGVNGPYFCPASYPSCAGKANSFDTLIMNKNKVYFNSENNVYSSVPAVIFSGGARYVGASSEWGRDTGPDSVIAAQPMLLSGGNVVFGGDDEAKRAGAGSRSFIGSRGSTVYIGVVHNANVAQVARVLKSMGLEYALNLDSGGSTALWSGGRYVVGPGRDTPFGILFLRR